VAETKICASLKPTGENELHRREFLFSILALSAVASCINLAQASRQGPKKKKILTSGEELPLIGMGTWVTFNVGSNFKLRDARTEVLKEFFAQGGGMIDSSPMYGSAEEVLGYGLQKLKHPPSLFSATKVWTSSSEEGVQQVKNSHELWKLKKFDLIQVHNLENWREHLKMLFRLKEKGELRYVGVTTSHGRRHSELESIMKTQPLDFVQLTYNIVDREVEERLLGLALDRKISIIANRPFRGGEIFRRLRGKPLPPLAKELDCQSWAEYLLKFVVSHPAVTCAIPATSRVEHMRENMRAGYGRILEPDEREKMLKAFQAI